MKRFLHGHATHPDPMMALALAAAQVEAQRQAPGAAAAPTLGWVYLTDACAVHADRLLADLRSRWPGVQWVGATGVGIAASGAEYWDEPAVSLLLAAMPREQFRVFSGMRPLGDFAARTANVHADPATPDLAELIGDLGRRTSSGYVFGGLASSGAGTAPLHLADRALSGGLSGVAFAEGVGLVSRVTQGCTPVGPQREIGAADRNVITELDGLPALDCLLADLGLEGTEPRAALPTLRQVLVGLVGSPAEPGEAVVGTGTGVDGRPVASPGARSRRGAFGDEVRVRHLIGLDPGRRGIAIADRVAPGMQLAFCVRNAEAARRDLTRICAELREEVEPEDLPLASALALKAGGGREAGAAPPAHGIAGAIYVSCSGRGGAHFGAPSAELAVVRHALGDVPLAGFFAAGEVAGTQLYGYTGVLTLFTGGA